MQFRTSFETTKLKQQLSYNSNILFTGSCFSENIGRQLQKLKFSVKVNPFGILYNPISIRDSFDFLLQGKQFTENDLHQHHEKWLSFYHHGQFSHTDKNTCLQQINEEIDAASAFLKKTDFIFITFGTAWIYEWKKNKKVVANCHKIPSGQFNKQLLQPQDIILYYRELLRLLFSKNPGLTVCFTLSPVRHLKDGFVENAQSKSILHVAIHQIIEEFPQCCYFPAYEMMMDDLRDYRFYEKDMVHPNNMAIEYIWEKFKKSVIYEDAYPLMEKLEKLSQAVNHRPLFPETKSHQRFISSQLKVINELETTHDFLDLSKEKSTFKAQLTS